SLVETDRENPVSLLRATTRTSPTDAAFSSRASPSRLPEETWEKAGKRNTRNTKKTRNERFMLVSFPDRPIAPEARPRHPDVSTAFSRGARPTNADGRPSGRPAHPRFRAWCAAPIPPAPGFPDSDAARLVWGVLGDARGPETLRGPRCSPARLLRRDRACE